MASDMVDPNCTTSSWTHFPIVRQWHTTSWSLSHVRLSHRSGLVKLFSIRSLLDGGIMELAINEYNMWVKHAKYFLSDTDYGEHKPCLSIRRSGQSDCSVIARIEPHGSLWLFIFSVSLNQLISQLAQLAPVSIHVPQEPSLPKLWAGAHRWAPPLCTVHKMFRQCTNAISSNSEAPELAWWK